MREFEFGMLVGSLTVGGLCGLLPLLVGTARKQSGLAIAGFVGCLVGGYLYGIFGALPVAIVSTVFVVLAGLRAELADADDLKGLLLVLLITLAVLSLLALREWVR